ncbi:MAG: CRTAC1 family protein, partial [Methylococcaceae bacterium]|nr:CRTAC1 family protein [Methylococcaceae bacterium]
YENQGNWRFKDVARQAGLDQSFYGMGAVAADYDGDGDADLLFTALDGLRLYRNEGGGRFADVSRSVGLHPVYWTNEKGQTGPEWSTAALLFDADGDGDLDILSAQYVQWSVEADIRTTYDTVHKGYTTPRAYAGQSLRLWLQEHGKFRDATSGSGFDLEGKALGLALWDFDDDGRLDVAIANDTSANFLFRNLGAGRFEEIGQKAGVAYDSEGNPRAGMGIDIADYRNDGSAGIAIGNFAQEPTSLFRMLKPWQFREDSGESGIAEPTFPLLTFGLVFADLDLDGWQDIVTANGHIEPAIRAVMPMLSYAQPLQWMRNLGSGRFADAGSGFDAFKAPMVGRGLAIGDLDDDGDLDLIATSNNGAPRVLRNDLTEPHYLRVSLRGLAPNTDAIGARILLHGEHSIQQRIVRTGGSYLSQSEMVQTFGLAVGESVRRLEVRWPDGAVCTISNLAPHRSYRILHPNSPDPEGRTGCR